MGIPLILNEASPMIAIGSMSPDHFSKMMIALRTIFMRSFPKCANSSMDLAEGNLVLYSLEETSLENKWQFIFIYRLCTHIELMFNIP
jgi:hypothetical protein